MLIHGFKLVSLDDESYSVRDSHRILGGIVRFWVPATDGGCARRFRAFGCDFESLSDAVAEFAKIAGAVPFNAMGDAEEHTERETGEEKPET